MRFRGESDDYRTARDELLHTEIELRRHIEAVAAARRALPPGGPLAEDYAFDGTDGPVRLSELFDDAKNTLVLYSLMLGPAMDAACPACTSICDGLDGQAQHIIQQVALAIVGKSPLPRLLHYAAERGWRHLRLLSSAGNTYNRDYFGETTNGDQYPMLSVFRRDGSGIRHVWGSELSTPSPNRAKTNATSTSCGRWGTSSTWRPAVGAPTGIPRCPTTTNRRRLMERVTGIGGLFFRSNEPAHWYRDNLGVDSSVDGSSVWQQEQGLTVFAPFEADTDYFGRPEQQWMVNLRVHDLDAMLAQLRAAGADVDDTITDMDGVGRFGWVSDPEGNRIELWQPVEA